jgi:hypothetical protein
MPIVGRHLTFLHVMQRQIHGVSQAVIVFMSPFGFHLKVLEFF